MRPELVAPLLCLMAVFAGCVSQPRPPTVQETILDPAKADVVVVAVIDSGFNPYHFDFLADYMPQALNDDPSDDLPLDEDPSTWVPDYPSPSSFASFNLLNLTLTPGAPDTELSDLYGKDKAEWSKVKKSTKDAVHVSWIPGTKVIGAVTFANSGNGYAPGSHGVGTSSVSVGNFHGTCPHCLLVFVDGLGEQANDWVASQPWIDLQTNSWGFSSTVVRDRIYAGSNTELQRTAIDRGQAIFFSAGNGIDGGYTVTNPTLFSSQEGPDWITTVGAVLPDGTTTGAGKPADISAPGAGYPSAYGSSTVNDTANFGGTSNATPVTAGLYAEALYRLRRELTGTSRFQESGTVGKGTASCGEKNPTCALSDGVLTAPELREALFRSAKYTGKGYTQTGVPLPQTENIKELTFLGAGHGTYWGLMDGEATYLEEVGRIVGFAKGDWLEPQDPEQQAWFVADSLCRQGGWGAWAHGYASRGLPAPTADPTWPVRTWMVQTCPAFLGAAVTVEKAIPPRSA